MKIKKKVFVSVILGLIFVCPGFSKSSGKYKNPRNYSYDHLENKELLTQEEFDKELDALEHLLKNTYVLYKKSVKKGFKMKTFLNDIRKGCPGTEDGLYKTSDLFPALFISCHKNFPYADSHFSLEFNNYFYRVFNTRFVCFSEVFFEKKGNDFFVVSSPDKNIKPGIRYAGKIENLYKCLTASGELYRFGVMTEKLVNTAELELESGKIAVHLKYENKTYQLRDTSFVKESGNILYIKCSDWVFGYDYESDAMTIARKKFEDIKAAAKNAFEKDYVIVDLRGNSGGMSDYSEELLNYIFFANEPKLIGPFTNNLKRARAGSIQLISSEIAYSESRISQLYNLFSPEYDPDLYPPEYKGLEKKPAKEFPSYNGEKKFKGKLIILTDKISASTSELFVAGARLIAEDSVILVGENTAGCISYGGVAGYFLPSTGIILNLSSWDYSDSAIFAKNKNWSGETYGFIPDYWATNDMLPETLEVLTGSKTIF